MNTRARHRLFVPDDLKSDADLIVSHDQAHYLLQVLRLGAGDKVRLFNGRDGEWLAEITEAGRKQAVLTPREQTRAQDKAPDLMLIFAPIKKARIDYLAEKAAELGVGILQPVITAHTQMTRVNTSRMRANTIEAVEQTGRTTLVDVREPIPLERLLDEWPGMRHIIFCDESSAGIPGHAMAEKVAGLKGAAAIVIGPEGGFSPVERARLSAMPGAVAVSLGQNVLRADTAMVAALAIWQAVAGEWKGNQHGA
ncbi:16S rRNA (uracil(1498)-N(3))-methyltransferase [Alphaproteobacteria bacterium LSUCC0684]